MDDLVAASGPMLVEAVRLKAMGAPERAQDEQCATQAPSIDPTAFRTPLEQWPAERAWHFLAGVAWRHHERLKDENGRPVLYRLVPSYGLGAQGVPGEVPSTSDGWTLHCRDGVVSLLR